MARSDKVGKVATKVTTISGRTAVQYHATEVVVFDQNTITLNSGGWQTVTTKRRMNQVANEYGLPFQVFQRKGDWFVTIGNETVKFHDGMQFARRQVYPSQA